MARTKTDGAPPQPTKFVCAVCDQTRPLKVDGKAAFVSAGGGNGNRICFGCVNAEDEKRLKEGQGITLSLTWSAADQRWMAVNPTGKVRVPVSSPTPGATDAQVLGAPEFEYGGRHWRGRFYPSSGTAHFVPIAARARGKAGAKGRTPARRGDKAKGRPAAAAGV